ncbi:hypothetical protein V6N12_049792 [Hibiscus sabdariffa]|uniref:Uncharacterized protein n=1 Tax=Hibiscus sabdariffa TaxID=183260 RepID=A0ABR2GBP8_9ROSI
MGVLRDGEDNGEGKKACKIPTLIFLGFCRGWEERDERLQTVNIRQQPHLAFFPIIHYNLSIRALQKWAHHTLQPHPHPAHQLLQPTHQPQEHKIDHPTSHSHTSSPHPSQPRVPNPSPPPTRRHYQQLHPPPSTISPQPPDIHKLSDPPGRKPPVQATPPP